MKKDIYRSVDANFNRSREGLRVCEEIARFILDDKALTQALKGLRHDIEAVLKREPDFTKRLLEARDVKSDVGKENSPNEFKRTDAKDIFEANIQRTKEAVRALEEFFKLIDKVRARRFKEIRFRIYSLEKGSVDKLEALAR